MQGVRNLIGLALASSHNVPPQILFTSSIGTMSNWEHDRRIPEEPFDDPSFAVGSGYGESKWVSERVRTGFRLCLLEIRIHVELGGDI